MKKHLLLAVIFLALFAALLILVCTVDVAAIGPQGTRVGLSHINGAVHESVGVHMGLYAVTQWLGYLALAVVAALACYGLVQWARRKSLAKVDRELLALGGLCVVLGVVYVFFETVVVNFRPVILPGETVPEASFPSSHTMLAYAIFGSTALLVTRYVKRKTARTALFLLCTVLGAATVLLRLFSGVHWLTDIVAGLLLSTALVELYSAASGLHNFNGANR